MANNRLNAYEYIMEFSDTYKKYKDAPTAIREAKCVEVQTRYWFQPMREDDLLAGRFLIAEVGYCSEPLLGRSVSYFYDPQRIDALLHSDAYTDAQKQDIRDALEFWKGEETRRKTRARFPEYMKQALPEDIYWEHSEVAFPLYRIVDAYMDYDKLMRLGLDGLKAEALRYQAKAEKEGGDVSLYEGMAMAVDTLSAVCLRYAEEARAAARTFGASPARREQRLKIAGALEAVAHKAPSTFVEAMQLAWLYSLISGVLNYGRMDVYLGDFYANDLAAGRITEEEALSYTQSLWRLMASRVTVFHSRVVIGGRGRRNEANADRFALLAIEASRTVIEIEPQLSLRFYKGQNPELMDKALTCIGEGRTFPMLYNDDVNIPAVEKAFEVSREEAEDYMMFGCGEYVLNHRSIGSPNGIINLLKALEATLYNGRDMLYDKDMGLKLGGLEDFETFGELYAAYKKQLTYYIEILAQQEQLEYEMVAAAGPYLYMSMLFDDCMERGKALLNGGAKYLGGTLETYGNVNTANSLYAIKTVVYEQGLIDRATLLKAMKANFEGYERERKLLLDAEKYGNDLPGVDRFSQEFHNWLCDTVRNQRERTSLHSYLIVIINNEANTVLGRFTGASPDGRLAREPMANGNNPYGGTDKNGVTAMLNSLVKLDVNHHAGAVQNMKFSKDLFNNHRDILESLLNTYFDNGGAQAMITVVSRDDLEQAMIHPEKYGHIMVRVGGFSARFVTLAPDVQREIASRTLY